MYLQNELIANQRKREVEEISKETWRYNKQRIKCSNFFQSLLTLIHF
ncbi:hypothetical protein [Halalkalibacter akibai]|nr:hypothetical protein [Halalkalibacter akibai]